MDIENMDAWRVEVDRITAQLVESLTPVFKQLTETFSQVAAVVNEQLKSISDTWQQDPSWEFVRAYIWACEKHPKWVNILNRTKKSRTRKKYQDRILRAYRKEINR